MKTIKYFWERMCTCRYCHKSRWQSDAIKYGTRAYACRECFIKHKTIKDAQKLTAHEADKLRSTEK
jgi:hypothetical protein